jgi:hypothetical protein
VSDLDTTSVRRVIPDPDETVDRARMAVARRAVDAAECRELLDKLGLLPERIDGQVRT